MSKRLFNFSDVPIISMKMAVLRDKDTHHIDFRRNLYDLGQLLAYEYAKVIPVKKVNIETPLGIAECLKFDTKIVIIAILRAAIPMAEGVHEILSDASFGFISASRTTQKNDIGTDFEIEVKYKNFPSLKNTYAILVDPMFATGSTIIKIFEDIYKEAPTRVALISAISTNFAIERAFKNYPDLDIITAAIDKKLNKQGYIVPGLGDAGDRAFNTKSH
ncbi:MAG: uracil phosphoribosyltransferase [Promethearchaeota archaeon]